MKALIQEVVVFVIVMVAIAAGCRAILGQESVQATAKTTAWQIETQAKLDAAAEIAGPGNRNVAVVIEPGRYEFVSLRIPPHVSLVFGTGLSPREGDLVYVGDGGDTCITLDGDGLEGTAKGYGMGLAGCQIRAKNINAVGVTGVRIEGCINPKVQNIRVDLRGVDTVGLAIAGRESVVVERCEIRGTQAIIYEWGDNVVCRDMDIGVTGNVRFGKDAVLTLQSNPHQLVFDGSQTWQGGRHQIYGKTSDNRTGQSLTIYNARWEQSTSADDPNCPGILIECEGRAFECLNQLNCRWSPRKNTSTVVTYPEGTALKPKFTELGCFKPRK